MKARCDHCGQVYNLRDELAGRKAKCRKCGEIFTVAAAPAAPSDGLDLSALAEGQTVPVAEQPAPAVETPTQARPPERRASPRDGLKPLWLVVGPPGKGLVLFAVFLGTLLVGLCAGSSALGGLLTGLVAFGGLGFYCTGMYWWARRVGRHGYSVLLHLLVPFYNVYFSVKHFRLVREPLYCMLRGLVLMALATIGIAVTMGRQSP